MTTNDHLDDALTATLAREGPGRLVSFTLACAAFVLPIYEAHVPGDDRLRWALRSDRQETDLRGAQAALDAAWVKDGIGVAYHAAVAAVMAAELAVRASTFRDTQAVWSAHQCALAAFEAVRLTLESASAQERLDWLGRMAGEASFDALLWRWLSDAACCAAAETGVEAAPPSPR